MPFQAQNALFEKLASITDVSALSEKDQERYEESLRIYRDNYAADEYSFNRGKAEGLAEGLKEGLKEGQAAERTMIARNLKENGVDIQVIIHCTGLTQEQIDQLQEALLSLFAPPPPDNPDNYDSENTEGDIYGMVCIDVYCIYSIY